MTIAMILALTIHAPIEPPAQCGPTASRALSSQCFRERRGARREARQERRAARREERAWRRGRCG
jgi:hypothetical protein